MPVGFSEKEIKFILAAIPENKIERIISGRT